MTPTTTTTRDKLEAVLQACAVFAEATIDPICLGCEDDLRMLDALANLFDGAAVLDRDILGDRVDLFRLARAHAEEVYQTADEHLSDLAREATLPLAQEALLVDLYERQEAAEVAALERASQEDDDAELEEPPEEATPVWLSREEVPADYQQLEELDLVTVTGMGSDEEPSWIVELTQVGQRRVELDHLARTKLAVEARAASKEPAEPKPQLN